MIDSENVHPKAESSERARADSTDSTVAELLHVNGLVRPGQSAERQKR